MTEGDAIADDIRFLDGVRAIQKVALRKAGLAAALGVQADDLVLEVGPGTGEDLQRFAGAAGPGGLGVGVELVAAIAEEAKRRAATSHNVVFVVADARHLPFRREVFNAVYAERVLQHVPGAEEAVSEMYRVMNAGSRVLLFEPDQELRAIDHPDRATEAIIRARSSSRFVNPTIGRQLFGLLIRAGFSVRSVDGTASGDPLGNSATQKELIEDAVSSGDIYRAAADQYLAELDERIADGSAFAVWIAFEIAGIKPTS